jgi:MFS family permease
MTWFSATAILPELTAHLMLSSEQAAWLTNGVQLGFALGALGSSLFALGDIWPLTRFMALSALFAGFANILLLFDLGASGAIFARFLTGVALAGIYPPAMKFIATWFKSGRGFAMGAMVGALTLGSAMPHLIRSLGNNIDWQIVVITCSLGSAAASAIFLFILKEGPYPFLSAKIDIRQFGAVIKNRAVMLANIGYFGHMWELYAMWGWFLTYASHANLNDVDLVNASALTFLVIAMGAPGCLLGGWLADKIGRCYTTIIMMSISGLAALMIGFVFDGPFWLFCVVALIWGLSVVADSAQFSAAVTELSDARFVGSSLAFQMGIGFAITIFVIWLTPTIAELLGSWRWTFIILVPGPIIGIFAMAILRRDASSIKMAGGLR